MSHATPHATSHAFPHSLLAFTGLYLLNDSFDQFVLIDADHFVDGATSRLAVTITISMGDKASQVVVFSSPACKFDGNTLTISYPDGARLAVLQFYKNPIDGGVAALNGEVYGRPVTGRTQFNPVALAVFATEYFQPVGDHFVGRLRINSDSTVDYKPTEDGAYLTGLPYKYNYAMFVLTVFWGAKQATFEMGTYPGAGRVAGILDGGGLWVSILRTS